MIRISQIGSEFSILENTVHNNLSLKRLNYVSLAYMYIKINFSSVKQDCDRRFDNYISFLKKNENPYEIKMNNITNLEKGVECFTGISNIELMERLELYHGHLGRKIQKLESRLDYSTQNNKFPLIV